MKLEAPRRHCRERRDSITSKGTEDINLDDGAEGASGLTAMVSGEPRKEDASRPDPEDEEEEELNVVRTRLTLIFTVVACCMLEFDFSLKPVKKM